MSIYRCPHCHDIISAEDLVLSYICEICGVEFNRTDIVDPINDGITIFTSKYRGPVAEYETVCSTCRNAVNGGVLGLIQELKDGKLIKEAEAVEAETRGNLLEEVRQNEERRGPPNPPVKGKPPVPAPAPVDAPGLDDV